MPVLNPTLNGGINTLSTTADGNYDYTFASLHELAWNPAAGDTVDQPEFRQNVYNKYYKLYGDGFRLTTFLYSAGLMLDDWTASRYTVFEEPELERTIEIEGTIAESGESEGSDIVFNVIAADADYRLEGFEIFIPGEYCNEGVSTTPKVFVVTDVTGTQVTASPMSSDTIITTDIPDGTLLTVGAAKFPRGGGQPAGITNSNLQRDFYLTIVGETQNFEGGVNTFDPMLGVIDSNGSKTLYAKGLWQMEFLLERAKDKAMWVSEFNTNNVTKAKSDSTTGNIESFVGLRNHLDDRAQQLPYDTSIEPQDIKIIREIYETQGVMADMSFMGAGARLYEGMQDSGFEFLKEYSGGHNLLTNMTGLGANFKVIDMYGHKLVVTELKTFSDRNSFGNPNYRFSEEGFIIPMSMFNVSSPDGKKLSLPNIGMGYRKGNNEDRTKMFGVVAGVNGMGFPFVDQWDRTSLYAKCEFGLVALGVNQWINITAI